MGITDEEYKQLQKTDYAKSLAYHKGKDGLWYETTIGPANPNSKSVLTKEEAAKAGVNTAGMPTQYELEHPVMANVKNINPANRPTDENGWIDNDGNVHLNSRATEARSKAAEEDVAEGRNFRDAKAPSASEVAQKEAEASGDYGAKDKDGNPVFSDYALQSALNAKNSTQAQKDAIQAEINRRAEANKSNNLTWADISADKQPQEIADWLNKNPEYKPGPKTQAGMAELGYEYIDGQWVAKEAAEALAEETPTDDPTANIPEGKGSPAIAVTEDGEQKNLDSKKNKKAVDRAQQLKNFLNNNPSMLKAIFGKSGLNFGERAARLGELLAAAVANGANGFVAGWHGNSINPVKGRWQEYYDKALNAQQERENKQLESAQSGSLEQEERWSMLKNGSTYFGENTDFADKVATYLGSDTIGQEEFNDKFGEYMKGWSAKDKQNVYEDYVSLHDQYMKGLEAQGKVLSNEGQKLSNESQKVENDWKDFEKSIVNEKNLGDYISELQKVKTGLIEMKYKCQTENVKTYWEVASNFMGIMKGVETATANAEKGNTQGANVSGKGTIPVIKIGMSGGWSGEWRSNTSSGTTTDVMAKAAIPQAFNDARVTEKNLKTYTDKLEAAIDEQITVYDNLISQAEQRLAQTKKRGAINDGIVKPAKKPMKQWIVREDGTKIRLNPKDYIYATKNKITSKKDDGSDVVPMQKEDKAVVLQRKLGYKGNGIDKNFAKYIERLGGEC